MEEADGKKSKAEKMEARRARQAQREQKGANRSQNKGADNEERARLKAAKVQEREHQQAAKAQERMRQQAAKADQRKEANHQNDRRMALVAASNSAARGASVNDVFKRAGEILEWLQKP